MAKRSLLKQGWYNTLHVLCRLASVVLFQIRVKGRQHVPPTGGVLVCPNHQSHLDPVLVGLALDRRLNYLAKRSLFQIPGFHWLIQSLDAIPIDRDGPGLGGLKETLRRLKQDEMVLIFPEGTRTYDGNVAPLKPGFVSLVRRARVPMLPIGIDGAFASWPRWKLLPWRATVHICIGEPIRPEQIEKMTDEQLVDELYLRMKSCLAEAREGRLDGRRQELIVGPPNGRRRGSSLAEITP